MKIALQALILWCCVTTVSCGEPSVVKQTEELIDSLTAKNKSNNWPRLGPLTKWHLSVNTFTHEIPSSTVEALYYRACKKLDALYGDQVTTYTWEDQMGYPGQVTIVQFKNEVRGDSYLVAGVFEANDNDSFWFSYSDGTYDVSKRTKKADWKLKGTLRCNQ